MLCHGYLHRRGDGDGGRASERAQCANGAHDLNGRVTLMMFSIVERVDK